MLQSDWCLFNSDLCLPASDWAAWVQAVGTIAAIAIAIAIPLIIHRAERKQSRAERNLRAKSYALALLPGLERHLSDVRTAHWKLREMEDHDDYDFILQRLKLPEELSGNQINLHELGLAGSQLQDALARMATLRVVIDNNEFYDRYGGVYVEPDGTEHDIDKPEDARPLFSDAINDLEVALSSIKGMFTSIERGAARR